MGVLPVFATAGESFLFPLTHSFRLLRRIALPTLVLVAAAVSPNFILDVEMSDARFADNPLVYSVFIVVAVAAFLNAFVGVLQVALETPEGSKWVSVDGSEVRVALYYSIWVFGSLIVILLAGLMGSLFPSATEAGELQDSVPKIEGGFGVLIVMLIAFAVPFFVWVYVRLVPMPAYIVATKSLDLKDGWTLGRGNSLRVLGASIVQGILLLFFIQLPSFAFEAIPDDQGWLSNGVGAVTLASEIYLLIATIGFSAFVYRGLTKETTGVRLGAANQRQPKEDHSAA